MPEPLTVPSICASELTAQCVGSDVIPSTRFRTTPIRTLRVTPKVNQACAWSTADFDSASIIPHYQNVLVAGTIIFVLCYSATHA